MRIGTVGLAPRWAAFGHRESVNTHATYTFTIAPPHRASFSYTPYLHIFGKRICHRRHFAEVVLFIVVASVFSVFNVEKSPDSEDRPLKHGSC
ncbi:hypothetical protein BJV78DRAFT_1169431 [Lactifluus subvellereus]|nr:hypothetical protein BJV78DRAFT_1169431 [Lactifluus subvellereus]